MRKLVFRAKRGGVSMFLVIIAGALFTLITTSFLRLVIRDQTRSSNADLSQSAYDSALAGVEDAKRFLSKYNTDCAGGLNLSRSICQKMHDALNAREKSCNMLSSAGIGASSGESLLQTTVTSTQELNQAYTCVKIFLNSPAYLGTLREGESKIISLRATSPFQKVVLEWHTDADLDSKGVPISLERINSSLTSNQLLLNKSKWLSEVNRPALLKALFIGYEKGKTNTFDTLDNQSFGAGAGLSERFYYPALAHSAQAKTEDILPLRRRGDIPSLRTNTVSPVKCVERLVSSIYACRVIIQLRHEHSLVDSSKHEAFLRLTSFYKPTHFKVSLLDDKGDNVEFYGIQPTVDSTGRANNHFRRVESRLEGVGKDIPLPDFAIQTDDVSFPLCKEFWTTNEINNLEEC